MLNSMLIVHNKYKGYINTHEDVSKGLKGNYWTWLQYPLFLWIGKIVVS